MRRRLRLFSLFSSVVDWSLVVVPSSIHCSFSLLHAELLFYMLYLSHVTDLRSYSLDYFFLVQNDPHPRQRQRVPTS
jgi:hypothetical protein